MPLEVASSKDETSKELDRKLTKNTVNLRKEIDDVNRATDKIPTIDAPSLTAPGQFETLYLFSRPEVVPQGDRQLAQVVGVRGVAQFLGSPRASWVVVQRTTFLAPFRVD